MEGEGCTLGRFLCLPVGVARVADASGGADASSSTLVARQYIGVLTGSFRILKADLRLRRLLSMSSIPRPSAANYAPCVENTSISS